MLCSPNNSIESCNINFPETIFYKSGAPVELYKNQSDSNNLLSIKTETKLSSKSIRKEFVTAVWERRKFINRQLYNKDDPQPYDERSYAHADMAIVRHFYDATLELQKPFVRVINEAEFSKLMDQYKATSKEW